VWTLARAIANAKANHWAGMRRWPNAVSHCKLLQDYWHPNDPLLDDIRNDDLVLYREYRKGLVAAATVHANLAVIPVLYAEAKRQGYTGRAPVMPSTYVPRKPKWWLNPDQAARVAGWFLENQTSLLADYVGWAVATGLRVEETLRLAARDFDGLYSDAPSVHVPGTKTAGAEARVPISQPAAEIARRRLSGLPNDTPLFGIAYMDLWRNWRGMRREVGLPEGATLKGLRRSFARALTVKGAPLPVVQQLLRHSSMSTTMEYLRLTGGQFTSEEVRKWL